MTAKASLLLAGPLLASCVPAAGMQPTLPLADGAVTKAQPRPGPSRPSTAQPQRTTQPVVQPFAWADAPLTPGRWAYSRGTGGRPAARFGPAGEVFQLECVAPGTIAVSRNGASNALTIRTSSTQRTLDARSAGGRTVVQLPAGDPLLDAMAFSRGRFGVQSPGAAPLVVPAWPELARVVEDCRR
jgi:hypothetical protein